jgi:hypothetical protein
MTVPHAGSGAARVIGDGDEAEWGGRGWVAICAIEPVRRRAMLIIEIIEGAWLWPVEGRQNSRRAFRGGGRAIGVMTCRR